MSQVNLAGDSAPAVPSTWRLLVARGLRSWVDGAVSVLLAGYLARLGFSPFAIGAMVTGMLFGSGALTLVVGLLAHRLPRRSLLLAAAVLMAATGVGFASFDSYWPLLVVGIVGTLNPSSGDVSVFLPLEQSALADAAATSPLRTSLFARYNVIGTLAGALGALSAGLPAMAAHAYRVGAATTERAVFVIYSVIAGTVSWVYWSLPRGGADTQTAKPLVQSRSVVIRLAALFSLDSFGSGFVVQSLLAMWLFRRFHLSIQTGATFFFFSNLAGALSQFLSPRLAARIGLVRTMVYTHVPACVFLIAAAFMPTLELTLMFLLLRASVSSMDVPARQAYVMAVVPPAERAAAASVTNVPRSLASAIAPIFTGFMLGRTSFGWPLVCAGVLKITYDFLLLHQFRAAVPNADP